MADFSALGDVIVDALKEVLRGLFSPITKLIEDYGSDLVDIIVGTPHPNSVFGPPTNGAWPAIYEYYWESMIPLSLFLWAVSIGLVIFFEMTSHLFSSYHRTKLKKRAFTGLLGILMWWWIAALSLRFMSALAEIIVPSLSDIALFETLSFSSMGVLGLVLTLSADFVLFVLIALIYLAREVVLYLFVLMMPILIALWVPGVGPFTLVSRFVSRLSGFYVPFLFMTIPVAILFRLGALLGSSFSVSMGGFGLWLTALVIPLIAVISPLVLFWQAGAIFFVADRASQRLSGSQARNRVTKSRDVGSRTAHGTRNFSRGMDGKPAIKPNGQSVLGSGDSRAHAAGKQLADATQRLQSTSNTRKGGGGSSGGTTGSSASPGQGPDDHTPNSGADASTTTDSSAPGTADRTQQNKSTNFETLRDRDRPRTRRSRSSTDSNSDDDRPRYIN
ncbi:hypothetical protein [Halorientalis halophila]|uniref:hypothetical protein n=1 Tax=Halorientalis halophila TaxID=3108499 RepID=UPI0030085E67